MLRNGRRWSQQHKSVSRLTHRDWITLRLLFYILSTDVSSVTVKDILWSQDYLINQYGRDTLLKAFELIRKDQIAIGAYDNPASFAMRNLQSNLRQINDPEITIEERVNMIMKGLK